MAGTTAEVAIQIIKDYKSHLDPEKFIGEVGARVKSDATLFTDEDRNSSFQRAYSYCIQAITDAGESAPSFENFKKGGFKEEEIKKGEDSDKEKPEEVEKEEEENKEKEKEEKKEKEEEKLEEEKEKEEPKKDSAPTEGEKSWSDESGDSASWKEEKPKEKTPTQGRPSRNFVLVYKPTTKPPERQELTPEQQKELESLGKLTNDPKYKEDLAGLWRDFSSHDVALSRYKDRHPDKYNLYVRKVEPYYLEDEFVLATMGSIEIAAKEEAETWGKGKSFNDYQEIFDRARNRISIDKWKEFAKSYPEKTEAYKDKIPDLKWAVERLEKQRTKEAASLDSAKSVKKNVQDAGYVKFSDEQLQTINSSYAFKKPVREGEVNSALQIYASGVSKGKLDWAVEEVANFLTEQEKESFENVSALVGLFAVSDEGMAGGLEYIGGAPEFFIVDNQQFTPTDFPGASFQGFSFGDSGVSPILQTGSKFVTGQVQDFVQDKAQEWVQKGAEKLFTQGAEKGVEAGAEKVVQTAVTKGTEKVVEAGVKKVGQVVVTEGAKQVVTTAAVEGGTALVGGTAVAGGAIAAQAAIPVAGWAALLVEAAIALAIAGVKMLISGLKKIATTLTGEEDPTQSMMAISAVLLMGGVGLASPFLIGFGGLGLLGSGFTLVGGTTLATGAWGFGQAVLIGLTRVTFPSILKPLFYSFWTVFFMTAIVTIIYMSAYVVPPNPSISSPDAYDVPSPAGGGSAFPCDEGLVDITSQLASQMQNGIVNLLPSTIEPRSPSGRSCIVPTMIVMHWSAGSNDNPSGNNATYNTLRDRGLACQLGTDTNDTWLMQPFYENEVEMAWCAGEWNTYSINNEMAGSWFTGTPPPPNLNELELAYSATCVVMEQYNIPWNQIYGHYQVPNNGGKVDPGKEFLENVFIPEIKKRCPNDTPGVATSCSGTVNVIGDVRKQQMTGKSWKSGCPVPIDDLRLIKVNYWGFDNTIHDGEVIVHKNQANTVLLSLVDACEGKFPIAKMVAIDTYNGSDLASMNANNTSAFNCREVTGQPGVWSEHAYGRAIDINPIQNPYISGATILPAAGASYTDRSQNKPGMIKSGDPIFSAFSSFGWYWGGNWASPKDYMHFSSTNK